MRAMNYEYWLRKFVPTGTPDKSTANDAYEGKMFETFGKDLDAIRAQCQLDAAKVWTLVDCDGKTFISPGFHHVNRMGYFITEKPVIDEMRDVLVM